jgi:hypothetical protein
MVATEARKARPEPPRPHAVISRVLKLFSIASSKRRLNAKPRWSGRALDKR